MECDWFQNFVLKYNRQQNLRLVYTERVRGLGYSTWIVIWSRHLLLQIVVLLGWAVELCVD